MYSSKAFLTYVPLPSISVALIAVLFIYSRTFRRLLIKLLNLLRRMYKSSRKYIGLKPMITLAILLVLALSSGIYLAISYHKEAAPWSAVAEFLETCRAEKVCIKKKTINDGFFERYT